MGAGLRLRGISWKFRKRKFTCCDGRGRFRLCAASFWHGRRDAACTCASTPELKIERVASEAHLQAYSDVNCAAYGFPLEWGHLGLGGSRLWRETAHTYLGYEKNDPVS